jgi:hypothetical protein
MGLMFLLVTTVAPALLILVGLVWLAVGRFLAGLFGR